MKEKYVIWYYSDEKLRSQRFSSSDLAWKYIGENHNCPSCQQDIADGGYPYDFLGKSSWHKIDSPAHTLCSAEWEVMTEKEAFEYFPPGDRL